MKGVIVYIRQKWSCHSTYWKQCIKFSVGKYSE